MASNASDVLYSPLTIKCKDEQGNIVPWASTHPTNLRPTAPTGYASERDSPLTRIAELFNVNHFIVSQARPYIAPFLRSDLHSPKPGYKGRSGLTTSLMKVMVMEVQHRLHQLDSLGYLPANIRRFLLDESIPGASLTLVPEVDSNDFLKLLENPTKQSVEYWILKGEKMVWPAVNALKVRCAVEVELDRNYQIVRRRKPFDSSPTGSTGNGLVRAEKGGIRKRSSSSALV
jgi:TAG lipase/lysophosphatidylethanolamine acyltransferase